MKPVLIPHESYQYFVLEQLREHYSGGVLCLVNKDWPVITKLCRNGGVHSLAVRKIPVRSPALPLNTDELFIRFTRIIFVCLLRLPERQRNGNSYINVELRLNVPKKEKKLITILNLVRHLSTKMWYIRIYAIMMCQHIDAWYSVQKETLDLKKGINLSV